MTAGTPLRRNGDGWMFWCPGCDGAHGFGASWTFDGNMMHPTVSPSLLSTYGTNPKRCHLFIRGGMLEFLSDCTHELAGQTVPMVPWPFEDEAPDE